MIRRGCVEAETGGSGLRSILMWLLWGCIIYTMLAGCGIAEFATRVPTKADKQRDDGEKEVGILLHEKPEHLTLAHLTKMVRCIPQIEIISHYSISRYSPSLGGSPQ